MLRQLVRFRTKGSRPGGGLHSGWFPTRPILDKRVRAGIGSPALTHGVSVAAASRRQTHAASAHVWNAGPSHSSLLTMAAQFKLSDFRQLVRPLYILPDERIVPAWAHVDAKALPILRRHRYSLCRRPSRPSCRHRRRISARARSNGGATSCATTNSTAII